MKKLLAILLATLVSSQVLADYRMIVPQQPGGGTDVWARIVAKELEKKLGEKIVIENIPGINDTPGFNKFHNELRKDPKVIMVAHGGNAEAYLTQKVDYDYHQYSLIGLQNLTIIVGKRNDQNVEKELRFAAGSGQNPDAMALTMLQCGPQPNLQAYLSCYNKRIIYVPGMGGGVRRLAYMNGELNVTRETTAAYLKNVKPLKQNVDWFTHGVLDLDTNNIVNDVNFPNILFNDVYARRWGVKPLGDFYEAYLLVRNYRDVLQKSLWVDKNNPNKVKLESALRDMVNDPNSLAAIEKDTGKYEWVIGEQAGIKVLNTLQSMTTEKNLKNLVWWMDNAFDQKVVYKPELVK